LAVSFEDLKEFFCHENDEYADDSKSEESLRPILLVYQILSSLNRPILSRLSHYCPVNIFEGV